MHAELRGETHGCRVLACACRCLHECRGERAAWDGAWYRRAFYDDGTPLGTATDEECRIDAIAQSWAVLSGAADPERAQLAMQAVNEQLVREDARLLLLLTPPFDRSPRDPGYIKGYVPGVRENGAQYTHAALWTVLAMARLGDGERAGELMRMLNPLFGYERRLRKTCGRICGRAVRRGRRRLRCPRARRSRRMDVVHGLRELELSRSAGRDIGIRERWGGRLRINPCIPATWPGFALDYRQPRRKFLRH